MANTTISPNMSLPVPVPGVDPGPDWADNIVADMYAIDSHDHSPGKGVQITPDGLNINADLPLNSNNLTEVRTVNFTPQAATIPAVAPDTSALFVAGFDLYYNDGAGNIVRITQGGNVTGSTGTITGLPSGTASASFAGGTFTWQAATNTPASMNSGPLIIGSATLNSKTVTLAPNPAMAANYSLFFPLVAPEANQVPVSDGSGNLSWTRGLIPLGSVIATFPNLAGAYTTAATTVADANGYVKCNGQTIVDATSPMNGAVVPNINNDVFLKGSTTAGTAGGAATSNALLAHTHGAGSFATSIGVTGGTSVLTGSTTFGSSAHTHNIRHNHGWAFLENNGGSYRVYVVQASSTSLTAITAANDNWMNRQVISSGAGAAVWNVPNTFSTDGQFFTTGALSPPTGGSGSGASSDTPSATGTVGISSTAASTTGSNSVTGTSASTGSGTSFSIIPTFISSVYLMRVK